MNDFPFNPDEPAFPSPETESNREMGLSITEYAAIHIYGGLSANPIFKETMSDERIAEMAVSQARALFAELNKSE